MVAEVLLGVLSVADTKRIGEALAPSVKNSFNKLPLMEILHTAFLLPTEEKYRRPLLNSLILSVAEICRTDDVQKIIKAHIVELRRDYEADSMGRAFVLSSLGLDDEKILAVLNEKLEVFFSELTDCQSERFAALEDEFAALFRRIAENHTLLANGRSFIMKEVADADVAGYIGNELKVLKR